MRNLLGKACRIVKRQTPFLNSIKNLSLFCIISLFLIHIRSMSSPCTMHSNLAVCPQTTAISFSGCKERILKQLFCVRNVGSVGFLDSLRGYILSRKYFTQFFHIFLSIGVQTMTLPIIFNLFTEKYLCQSILSSKLKRKIVKRDAMTLKNLFSYLMLSVKLECRQITYRYKNRWSLWGCSFLWIHYV